MAAPLSQDLRRFTVSLSAAIKLVRRRRQAGSTALVRIGGHCQAVAGRAEVLKVSTT